ncbi:unnamed protein product [Pleuronectes platessa]|uniref:Uncharacterized protein n=1 Tax=Pleuronectes platessa TaxID=8262 RepID=A0A9N7VDU9_PLEPL|nr:unnamed protein product [Pleuronectes platessa]
MEDELHLQMVPLKPAGSQCLQSVVEVKCEPGADLVSGLVLLADLQPGSSSVGAGTCTQGTEPGPTPGSVPPLQGRAQRGGPNLVKHQVQSPVCRDVHRNPELQFNLIISRWRLRWKPSLGSVSPPDARGWEAAPVAETLFSQMIACSRGSGVFENRDEEETRRRGGDLLRSTPAFTFI